MLHDALSELLDEAAAAGVDDQLVRDAAAQLAALLVRNFRLARAADYRKAQTADLARRVAKADGLLAATGMTTGRVVVLAQQFGRSNPTIYRLLKLASQ